MPTSYPKTWEEPTPETLWQHGLACSLDRGQCLTVTYVISGEELFPYGSSVLFKYSKASSNLVAVKASNPTVSSIVNLLKPTGYVMPLVINWVVFTTELKSVYCAVRPGSLTKAVFVSSLTLRRLSYIYGAPILDVSRSHTTTQHSR